MRLLLDSHAVLWWLTDSNRLSRKAAEAIADRANSVLVSAASCYELHYKASRGRLAVQSQALDTALDASGFESLAISSLHATEAGRLGWAHGDPWDRILAAQARLENCALVSLDEAFDKIGLERLW